ncbi:MAG TPA: hypothetical protein VFE50_11940 [Cyclobacteriaceae bacterium]|nr:hypothetical protein [Cyclobacteriaceae bacterium]
MKHVLLVLIVVGTACTSEKQIDYFGQAAPQSTAVPFAPGLITSDGNEHSAVAFAPDGSSVLWTVMDKNYVGRLYEMTYSNGAWSKPAMPSFADTVSNYFAPTFSADGKTLLFNSRMKADGLRTGRGNRIWSVERTESGWGKPVPFDTLVSKGDEFALSVANSGALYFSSASKSVGTSLNILMTTKTNGQYSDPALLPYNINTPAYEDGPYISPDESYLVFESTRPDGIGGSHDLYVSFRNDKGEWELPVNLGPGVNSDAMERFPRVTPDGKYLIFASNRDQSATRPGFDMYWVDAKVISDLKRPGKAIDPNNGILHESDSAKLEQSLKKWLSENPANTDGLLLYSSLLRKQKRFEEAEKLVDGSNLLMETALVKYGLDKNEEAEHILRPWLLDGPNLRHHYLELTNALYDMSEFDVSDAYFEKAMAIEPVGVWYYNRACGYAHKGETDRVFMHLNKAADNGYNSKRQYESDTDLAGVRSDRRYRELLKKLL